MTNKQQIEITEGTILFQFTLSRFQPPAVDYWSIACVNPQLEIKDLGRIMGFLLKIDAHKIEAWRAIEKTEAYLDQLVEEGLIGFRPVMNPHYGEETDREYFLTGAGAAKINGGLSYKIVAGVRKWSPRK